MEIPLFGIGLQGKSPVVSSQSRVNCYYQFERDADRTLVSIHGTPGLKEIINFGNQPIRGGLAVGSTLYVVHRNKLFSLNNAFIRTELGTLNTDRGIIQCANNGLELLIVDGVNGYIYNYEHGSFFQIKVFSTGNADADNAGKLEDSGADFITDGVLPGMAIHNVTDGTRAIIEAVDSATVLSLSADIFANGEEYEVGESDFPNGATTCGFVDNYFLVELGSRFFISRPLFGMSWDGTEFSSAEQAPDGIVRLFVDHQDVILFGTETTEYFGNNQGVDFPFVPIQGTSDEWGLAAKWSVAKFDNSYMYLAQNTMGEVMLVRSSGYAPTPINDQAFHSIINDEDFGVVTDARAFAYLLGGHPMYQITFPSAGRSFLYDRSTDVISEMQSYNMTRHRADLHFNFLQKNYVTDYEQGIIFQLDTKTYKDGDLPIVRKLVSRHDHNKQHTEIIVDRLEVLMETGVGLSTGQGSDPKMMLRVSKDLGRSFGVQMLESVGKMGEYQEPRVLFEDLGSARDFIYELSYSEPTKFVITGVNRNKRDAQV